MSIAATSSQSVEFNTVLTTSLPILPKAPDTSTGMGFLGIFNHFFKKFFFKGCYTLFILHTITSFHS